MSTAAAAKPKEPKTSGTFTVQWEGNANLVYPISLDSAFKGKNGKMVEFKNLDGQLAKVVLQPTVTERNGKKVAVHVFDMDIPEQKIQGEYIKAFAEAGGFRLIGAKVKLIDEIKEAQANVARTKGKFKLIGRIEEIISTAEGLRNLALNMGISLTDFAGKPKHPDIIESEVFLKADVTSDTQAKWLQTLLGDANYEARAAVLYAKESGIIEVRDGNWFFGETHMGMSVDDAVKYAASHDVTMGAIVQKIKAL